MEKISVFGGGSWGTALANSLALRGHPVLLWCRRASCAQSIAQTHANPDYLKEIALDPRLSATSDLAEAAGFSDLWILAVPAQALRGLASSLFPFTKPGVHLLNLAKGIEIATGKLLHVPCEETLKGTPYSILSGPSHAEEVARDLPTAVVVASKEESEAKLWQNELNSTRFRVYTSDDVIGVEIGGAVKNVIAIAVGIAKAMGLGDNALAALACRGLAEISRLGHRLGAHPLTLAGLAGVGDLMVTCYSLHSRNLRLGLSIGSGKTFEEAASQIGQVAEGAYTVRALVAHAQELDVELPIAEGVHRILYEGASPEAVMNDLLTRDPKPERDYPNGL